MLLASASSRVESSWCGNGEEGSSPHVLSQSDLTPEEQEISQKSVRIHPSAISRQLDFNFRKNQLWYGRWTNCAKKIATRMHVIQVSHHSSSIMEDQWCVKPTTTFPLLSLARKQRTTRRKLWITGSRHELWATVSCKCLAFNHARKDWQGILKFDTRTSSWRGHTTASSSSSTHLPAKPSQTSRREAPFIHFPISLTILCVLTPLRMSGNMTIHHSNTHFLSRIVRRHVLSVDLTDHDTNSLIRVAGASSLECKCFM